MPCRGHLLGISLSLPPESSAGLFGFAEFLAALALLILVFNATDVRYRFGIETAPIPLYPITFATIALIGFGTLINDLWFSERWLAPSLGISRAVIDAFFGVVFLGLILTWTMLAFVRPPRFGRWNAQRYASAVYRYLMRGSPDELDAVATQIAYSSKSLIAFASRVRANQTDPTSWIMRRNRSVEISAYNVLRMIAHKRLCNHIMLNNSMVAAFIMEDAASRSAFMRPVGEFSHHVTLAALENRKSILYDEGDYFTGLIGDTKRFLNGVYGCHALIEWTGHSALDLDYRFVRRIEGDQLEMYGKAVLTTFENYLDSGFPGARSTCVGRALDSMTSATSDLHSLNQVENYFPSNADAKLSAVTETIGDMIRLLGDRAEHHRDFIKLRKSDAYNGASSYDDIAEDIVELMFHAGSISGPAWTAWSIQHNSVWNVAFSGTSPKSFPYKTVQFKVARLVFDELTRMETFPNFKGAKLLRVCLNVMSWNTPKKEDFPSSSYAIRKAVLAWTAKNYVSIHEASQEVAHACLTDDMRYEVEANRLVRVHEKNLFRDKQESVLLLQKASAS